MNSMPRIEIKVSHADREVHKTAIELYMQYVGNLMNMENKGLLHVQYSILYCLHYDLLKYFNKRSHPDSSTLKLDPHNAHSMRDALLYLQSTSKYDKEKAMASRLFTQIDSKLSHDDRFKLIIN